MQLHLVRKRFRVRMSEDCRKLGWREVGNADVAGSARWKKLGHGMPCLQQGKRGEFRRPEMGRHGKGLFYTKVFNTDARTRRRESDGPMHEKEV